MIVLDTMKQEKMHNAARIINFKTGAVYYLVSEPLHNFNYLFSIQGHIYSSKLYYSISNIQ